MARAHVVLVEIIVLKKRWCNAIMFFKLIQGVRLGAAYPVQFTTTLPNQISFCLCVVYNYGCIMHMINNLAKWIQTNFTEKKRIFYMSCSVCIYSHSTYVLAHSHSKSYFHTWRSPCQLYSINYIVFAGKENKRSTCTVFLRYLSTWFLTSCPWWGVTYELWWVAGENPLQHGM